MRKGGLKIVPKVAHRDMENEVVMEKLDDACTPGFVAPFTPGEARRAGAFVEDAISEIDAKESCIDLPAALDSNREQPS